MVEATQILQNGYGALSIESSTDIGVSPRKIESSLNAAVKNFGFVVFGVFLLSLIFFSGIQHKKSNDSIITNELSSSGHEKGKVFLGPFSHGHWKVSTKTLSSDFKVTFFVSLKLRNLENLHDHLMAVSSPDSKEYGNHLSLDDIHDMYSPSMEDQIAVMDFFEQMTEADVNLNTQGDMIRVDAKVTHVEAHLKTQLALYSHIEDETSVSLRATKSISLPDHVADLVGFVSLNTPIVHMTSRLLEVKSTDEGKPDKKVKASEGFSIPGTTPASLAAMYGISPFPYPVNNKGSTMAIASFYGQMFSNNDLQSFMQAAGLGSSYKAIPSSNVFGTLPNNPNSPGVEASLDVQTILGIASGLPLSVYSMMELNPYDYNNEGFLNYLWVVGNQTSPPLVHSISYADDELSVFQTSNPAAVVWGKGVEQQFQLMGLRGLTVLVAAGDSGISGLGNYNQICQKAWPMWPPSSPYVTSVGGTMVVNNNEVVCSTANWAGITSGGGFSNVNSKSLASWQSSAVSSYLQNSANQPSGSSFFNNNGRAYPDVALLATDYIECRGQYFQTADGTSASTPLFAGMIALVNDARIAKGLKPMGFLNPFLYTTAVSSGVFNDITSGNNACSSVGNTCCAQGFKAAAGWDAVSGLGSINFPNLMSAALGGASPVVAKPTGRPTSKPLPPTNKPVALPTNKPVSVASPTNKPVAVPTNKPVAVPTNKPVAVPTNKPK